MRYREAIRAPSVARYALGVAVACERRRDSSRENVSNPSNCENTVASGRLAM
jgi:hypothetical protein